jgi:hypothetical protein
MMLISSQLGLREEANLGGGGFSARILTQIYDTIILQIQVNRTSIYGSLPTESIRQKNCEFKIATIWHGLYSYNLYHLTNCID